MCACVFVCAIAQKTIVPGYNDQLDVDFVNKYSISTQSAHMIHIVPVFRYQQNWFMQKRKVLCFVSSIRFFLIFRLSRAALLHLICFVFSFELNIKTLQYQVECVCVCESMGASVFQNEISWWIV